MLTKKNHSYKNEKSQHFGKITALTKSSVSAISMFL